MNAKATLAKALSLNAVIWLAMLLAFTGLLFCAAGVYMLLGQSFGQTIAALITGGGLIALVAILLLLVLIVTSGKKKSKAKAIRRNPDNLLEQQLRPMIGDQATNWAKRNTGVAVVGALSAGVLLAASPRLRSLLLGAAGPLATRKAIQALQDLSDNGE